MSVQVEAEGSVMQAFTVSRSVITVARVEMAVAWIRLEEVFSE